MSIGDGDMTITEINKMDVGNMVLESMVSSREPDLS